MARAPRLVYAYVKGLAGTTDKDGEPVAKVTLIVSQDDGAFLYGLLGKDLAMAVQLRQAEMRGAETDRQQTLLTRSVGLHQDVPSPPGQDAAANEPRGRLPVDETIVVQTEPPSFEFRKKQRSEPDPRGEGHQPWHTVTNGWCSQCDRPMVQVQHEHRYTEGSEICFDCGMEKLPFEDPEPEPAKARTKAKAGTK